jgi:CDGSH-type Zn-finger protein
VQNKSDASKQVWFCGCKHTKNRPLCDGTHSRI